MYIRYDNRNYLQHYGIKGQQRGIRRFQNEDGSLTPAGKIRYGRAIQKMNESAIDLAAATRDVADNEDRRARNINRANAALRNAQGKGVLKTTMAKAKQLAAKGSASLGRVKDKMRLGYHSGRVLSYAKTGQKLLTGFMNNVGNDRTKAARLANDISIATFAGQTKAMANKKGTMLRLSSKRA